MLSQSSAGKCYDFFFALPQIIFIYPSGTNLQFFKNTNGDDYDDRQTHEATKERLGGAIPPECIIRCQKLRVQQVFLL